MKMTKICSLCGVEFDRDPHVKKQSRCRPCKQKYDREYHKSRPLDTKLKKQELQLKRVHENKLKIYQYLSTHSCVMCGEGDPIVLEFDHIDQATKSGNIADMYCSAWSVIDNEIKKCRVLCANCHRRHTASQMDWYKYVTNASVAQ